MSDRTTTVRVEDISVTYDVFSDRRAGIRDRLLTRNATGRSTVSALKNVSFQISEGESVGLVGLNGAGKSTLMMAVAGLLPVTSGNIYVADEPRLMGVGVSLIGNLSGRDNIRLGCLALGASNDELPDLVQELADFTDLGAALDRPFKTYSSGMKARIQFVIATARSPRILLIDEGLGVGDKKFRAKSGDKVLEIIESAGTFLFVNHSMGPLRRLCTRGIWLDDGQVVMDAPMEEVIASYDADS